jgi:hypothetical protein
LFKGREMTTLKSKNEKLFEAVEECILTEVILLLQEGADVNAELPIDKITPIEWAWTGYDEAMIELLRKHGARD